MIRIQYQVLNRRNSSLTLEVGVFLPEEEKAHLARLYDCKHKCSSVTAIRIRANRKKAPHILLFHCNIYPGTFPDLLQGMYAVVIDQCDPFLFSFFSFSSS